MSIVVASVSILLCILIPAMFYAATKYNKTENELIKLLGLCESIYDLKDVSAVPYSEHFKANLLGKNPLKLYSQEVQSKFWKKYG